MTQEGEMLARFNGANPLADLKPVADGPEILELQHMVQQVYVDPVLSEGIRSGVHWMRLKEHWRDSARHRARVVLPIPGTSSTKICPPLNTAARVNSMTSPLPTNTFSMLALILAEDVPG